MANSDRVQMAGGNIWCMGDFLVVVGIVIFTVAMLALIKGLEHV